MVLSKMSSTTRLSIDNALQTNDDGEKSRLKRMNGCIAEQNKQKANPGQGTRYKSKWMCTKWEMPRIKSQRWNRRGMHRWFMNHFDTLHELTSTRYISTPSHKKASYLHAHKKNISRWLHLISNEYQWLPSIINASGQIIHKRRQIRLSLPPGEKKNDSTLYNDSWCFFFIN